MRLANHVVLNFERSNNLNTSSYWASKLINDSSSASFLNDLNLSRRFGKVGRFYGTTSFFQNQKKFTLNFNNETFDKDNNYNLFKPTIMENRDDINKLYLTYSKAEGRVGYLKQVSGLENFYIENVLRTLVHQKSDNFYKHDTLYNSVNVNFIRKERIYTKLKYSRTPSYDIVSGGSAVLLAGFLGFLASEKFGIELVDSGDFYYLWMYGVFLVFSFRPLLTASSSTQSIWSLLSLRYLLNFLTLTFTMLIKLIKGIK